MESQGSPALAVKKTSLTPKAIIHQRFGSNACYKVEEVQESAPNGCPGLSLLQKGPCLYRCSLQLPEVSVVSEIFKRKKDAMQSAAEKAIEKLGINPTTNNTTSQEAWDELVSRLSYLFSNEFLTTIHPLSGHFRAALLRKGHLYGSVPVSVISVFDTKLINLCKCMNSEAESNHWLVMSLVLKAAARLPSSLSTSDNELSIQRANPYPPEVLLSIVNQQSCLPESAWIRAIHVPYSVEKTVEPLTLKVSVNGYYLDVIARELGVTDASEVMVSRNIGKASSETRLYFCAPKSYLLDVSSELYKEDESIEPDGYLNKRASYFSGQLIHGDAILASIGYTRKSTDLFCEDVSLRTYYRILINKIPSGVYKLSREAILVAELPVAFTTRSNWRGSFPRDILCAFCRQHRLSEPVFSTANSLFKLLSDLSGSRMKLKVTESSEQETNGCGLAIGAVGSVGTFKCEVKIYSKTQELIMLCTPKESFKRQSDSIQNAALKILSWFNKYFKKLDTSIEKLTAFGEELAIQFYPECFFKEFLLCRSVHDCWQNTRSYASRVVDSDCRTQQNVTCQDTVFSINIDNQDSGISPSTGSLVCIRYSISLLTEAECVKELVESSEEFEFEIGVNAVVPHLEAVVTQMSVGQSTCYSIELPPQELVMAAAADSERTLSLLSSSACSLEYSLTLLRVTEPLEERMEQALFSPPLSKQRVEFALQHIKESCASSLVDFGCGSGSLLDSLLAYPTSLEKIAGVDISQKSLARAAKTLDSKLATNSEAVVASNGIKSALLYNGSITLFDSRLYGFDIGSCLEVIEHMEEDQACVFGNVVLSSFYPKILIISTPNYEYNVILQKSNLQSQEEDPDEKNQTQSCKFRNHDHKFEWTREQFQNWASDLAERHNYSVEFGGVGGVDGVEPGFASQIAVFRRLGNYCSKNVNAAHHYEVLWEWSSSDR